jgi:RNA polymerase sigma-70 factor (ECF subfamily)
MGLLDRDRDLLASFRAGDRAALADVYRQYAPVVARVLSRGFSFRSENEMLRFRGYDSAFDLENAMQETFTRAFREPARRAYDGIRPYEGYLVTIARNFVLDELRGREQAASDRIERVMDAASDPHELGLEGMPDENAEEHTLHRELASLCGTFVGGLSEESAAFFRARFVEGRTQIDAGKAAGLSHMQARTLEKRLRERFLGYLHSKGWLEAYHA